MGPAPPLPGPGSNPRGVMFGRLVRGMSENAAETRPDSPDSRLRGRTYSIPFDAVWNAALLVAEEDMGRWEVLSWDDRSGVIVIEAQTPVFRWIDDVRISVSLDQDAQTRIDLTSRSRKGHADLGTNARRIGKFFRLLDGRLGLTGPQPRGHSRDADHATAR